MTVKFLNEMIKKRVTAFFIVMAGISGFIITAFIMIVVLFLRITDSQAQVLNCGIISVLSVPIGALILHVYNKRKIRDNEGINEKNNSNP